MALGFLAMKSAFRVSPVRELTSTVAKGEAKLGHQQARLVAIAAVDHAVDVIMVPPAEH